MKGDAQDLPALQFYQIDSVWFNLRNIYGVHAACKMDSVPCPRAIKDGPPLLLAFSEVSGLEGH